MVTGREVLEHAFRETAKGNGHPFVDMLADDVEWSIIGSTEWSETFRGKSSVIADLLRPLAEQFDGPNTVEATRFIAEGNLVAVEGRNLSVTKRGRSIPTDIAGYSRCGTGKRFASPNIATRLSSRVSWFAPESERPPFRPAPRLRPGDRWFCHALPASRI
jgi:ketosteroid isomerase-like protein